MDEDHKRRFDAIAQLYQRNWEQFNDRRRHEFKVTLTYWAALAVASAGSLKLAHIPKIHGGNFTLVGFALLIILLHALWVRGVWRAQGTDQHIAIFYQKILQTLSDTEFDQKMKGFLEKRTKQMGKLSHPSAIFEIGVTVLLAATFVLINWNRM